MNYIVTADGTQTLYSEKYAQSYHSDKGARTESQHVFLDATLTTQKLDTHQPTSVLEVGFGTGLNYFLTASHALRTRTPLTYTALEHTLLPASTLESLGYQAFCDTKLFEAFLAFRHALGEVVTPGVHVFEFGVTTLALRIGDATEQRFKKSAFDAVYQDAFSPDANPELWSDTFFTDLFNALKSGGILSTYSVKGVIRRRLLSIGFKTEKRPGPPGGKREMLVAMKP